MPTSSYEQLIAEHDEIDRLCRDLIARAERRDVDAKELAQVLRTLEKAIADHLSCEDELVYAYALKNSSADNLTTVAAMSAELDALTLEWTAYLREWPVDAIAADPASFRDASRGMLGRVRARVARESSILYAALLRANTIRLRAV